MSCANAPEAGPCSHEEVSLKLNTQTQDSRNRSKTSEPHTNAGCFLSETHMHAQRQWLRRSRQKSFVLRLMVFKTHHRTRVLFQWNERLPRLWRGRAEIEFFIVNLLVRIHLIIVMIRWTGLAPWDFESPFPGSLTPTFLEHPHSQFLGSCQRWYPIIRGKLFSFHLLVMHFTAEMI